MSLEGIEVFAEVVDAQSFSRAARRIGMPVSTVSAKVARLEDRLGVTLIQRTTRQLNVTEAGQNYYDYCVRALAQLAEAEQHLAQSKTEPSGVLRLTAPADLAQSVLTPLVNGFLHAYPQVRVDLTVTNRTVDLIAENIDLAIRVGQLTDSSLKSRKFLEVRMSLWAAPAYLERLGTPATVQDLQAHESVALNIAGPELPMWDGQGQEHKVPNKGRIATDDMQSCLTFIEAGTGIGILPDFVGVKAAQAGRLQRVLPDLASKPASAYFVFPAQRFVPQNVRAFIDWASQGVAQSV